MFKPDYLPVAVSIQQALLGTRRLRAALGNPRDLESIGSERFPRFTGTLEDGTHIVVIVKYTGSGNAARYRHWLTMAPREWAAATEPPEGWHYFVAQVGRQPDGQPWWLALYDIEAVLEAVVQSTADDGDSILEQVNVERGHFYRINPVDLPEHPVLYDFQSVTIDDVLDKEEPVTKEPEVVFPSDDHGGRQKERRARLVTTVDAAFDILTDPEQMRLMPGNQLLDWQEKRLPAAVEQLNKWARVRVQQSFSKPRAEAKAEAEDDGA